MSFIKISWLVVLALVFSTSIALASVAGDVTTTSDSAINSAQEEKTMPIVRFGTLIEIGNTTADQTTIIIRVQNDSENTEDVTLEINNETILNTENGKTADLSDWIAGDQIRFQAQLFENSEQLVATHVWNMSAKARHKGINGWITAIRTEAQEIDVEWLGRIFTLQLDDARLVAGVKNPATIDDFAVGDRIRARVVADADGSDLTWDAEIVVVLRRGESLFMRVTRWVVPGVIVSLPEDTDTLPVEIQVEVLDNLFYEPGDVNNKIGQPGDIITVRITEDTKLVRRFLGQADLSEFSEGDVIRILGRTDDADDVLVANVVKNNAIQKLGVANKIVTVTDVDTENGTVKVKVNSESDVEYTITINGETHVIKLGQDADTADIAIGDQIRIRGIFNRINTTVDADTVSVIVRDALQEKNIQNIDELRQKFDLQQEQMRSRIQEMVDSKMDSIRIRVHEQIQSQLKNRIAL